MRLTVSDRDYLHKDALAWLLVAQALSIFPLLLELPFWVPVVWLLALLWRLQIYRRAWPFPSAGLKLFLGVTCMVVIVASYSGRWAVESLVAFLVCSFVLKLIEMRTKKDALVILFIGFIAVASQFLFAQSILTALYGIFSLLILLTAWRVAFYARRRSVKKHLMQGGVLILQSLPFMVVLFVVMPRLGPLWSVPLPQGHGQTGFSDTLTLGDIGELVKSHELAFRVSFTGPIPTQDKLYWRGLVLDRFDGRAWHSSSTGVDPDIRRVIDPHPANKTLSYLVILEPHYQRWLFSLNAPVRVDSPKINVDILRNQLLAARALVTSKTAYSVISVELPPSERVLTQQEQQSYTALPREGNNRARALGETLREKHRYPEDIAQAALSLFAKEFHYTLRPGSSGDQAIDEFLFDTKRGFCEHFASSFVFLMRSAGIPARIVVGYQGGSINDVESYLAVRQSDAHAWAEIWSPHWGWKAVDPTAVVAPSRIEFGVEEALDAGDRSLVGRGAWRGPWFSAAYQHWDALGYSWNLWVLSYDNDRQEGLLRRLLGNVSPWRVGLAFTVACAAIFLSYAAFAAWMRRFQRRSVEYELVRPVLHRLSRAGFIRKPEESLLQFVDRVAGEKPELEERLHTLVRHYDAAVYAGDRRALKQLRLAISRFRVS